MAAMESVPDYLTALALGVALAAYLSYRRDNRFFRKLALSLAQQPTPARTREEVCLRLLEFSSRAPMLSDNPEKCQKQVPGWVRLYYRWNPLKPGPRAVLRYGTSYDAPCGSRSRLLAALLDGAGIPARLTNLHFQGKSIHTVVEARYSGKWVVMDPTYGLVFRDIRGNPMSAAEVRAEPKLFLERTRGVLFTGVPFHAEYRSDIYVYDDVYPFDWDAVPRLLPALRRFLRRFWSEESLKGTFRHPRSYRRPNLFLAQSAGCLALALLLVRFLVTALLG